MLVRYADHQPLKVFATGRRSRVLIFRYLRTEVEVRFAIRRLLQLDLTPVSGRLPLLRLTGILAALETFSKVHINPGVVHQITDVSLEGVSNAALQVFAR